jgi:hypothetical protein
MDEKRFEELVARLMQPMNRQRLIQLLTGAAASGAAALGGHDLAEASKGKGKKAKRGKKGKKGKARSEAKGKGQAKVTLCHKPGTPAEHTIVVAEPAVAAHLAHGDTLGACEEATTTTTTTTAEPTTTTTTPEPTTTTTTTAEPEPGITATGKAKRKRRKAKRRHR